MEIIKAIEKLNWKKEELKKLDDWIVDLEIYNHPVNGIHWRKLKTVLKSFADEMQDEIVELESKINEVASNIEVDI